MASHARQTLKIPHPDQKTQGNAFYRTPKISGFRCIPEYQIQRPDTHGANPCKRNGQDLRGLVHTFSVSEDDASLLRKCMYRCKKQ